MPTPCLLWHHSTVSLVCSTHFCSHLVHHCQGIGLLKQKVVWTIEFYQMYMVTNRVLVHRLLAKSTDTDKRKWFISRCISNIILVVRSTHMGRVSFTNISSHWGFYLSDYRSQRSFVFARGKPLFVWFVFILPLIWFEVVSLCWNLNNNLDNLTI